MEIQLSDLNTTTLSAWYGTCDTQNEFDLTTLVDVISSVTFIADANLTLKEYNPEQGIQDFTTLKPGNIYTISFKSLIETPIVSIPGLIATNGTESTRRVIESCDVLNQVEITPSPIPSNPDDIGGIDDTTGGDSGYGATPTPVYNPDDMGGADDMGGVDDSNTGVYPTPSSVVFDNNCCESSDTHYTLESGVRVETSANETFISQKNGTLCWPGLPEQLSDTQNVLYYVSFDNDTGDKIDLEIIVPTSDSLIGRILKFVDDSGTCYAGDLHSRTPQINNLVMVEYDDAEVPNDPIDDTYPNDPIDDSDPYAPDVDTETPGTGNFFTPYPTPSPDVDTETPGTGNFFTPYPTPSPDVDTETPNNDPDVDETDPGEDEGNGGEEVPYYETPTPYVPWSEQPDSDSSYTPPIANPPTDDFVPFVPSSPDADDGTIDTGENDMPYEDGPDNDDESEYYCTEDVKICPDGTYVGRDPSNNCEFRDCLDNNSTQDDPVFDNDLPTPVSVPGGFFPDVDDETNPDVDDETNPDVEDETSPDVESPDADTETTQIFGNYSEQYHNDKRSSFASNSLGRTYSYEINYYGNEFLTDIELGNNRVFVSNGRVLRVLDSNGDDLDVSLFHTMLELYDYISGKAIEDTSVNVEYEHDFDSISHFNCRSFRNDTYGGFAIINFEYGGGDNDDGFDTDNLPSIDDHDVEPDATDTYDDHDVEPDATDTYDDHDVEPDATDTYDDHDVEPDATDTYNDAEYDEPTDPAVDAEYVDPNGYEIPTATGFDPVDDFVEPDEEEGYADPGFGYDLESEKGHESNPEIESTDDEDESPFGNIDGINEQTPELDSVGGVVIPDRGQLTQLDMSQSNLVFIQETNLTSEPSSEDSNDDDSEVTFGSVN